MKEKITAIINEVFSGWDVSELDNLIYIRKKGESTIVEDMNYMEALYDISEEELRKHFKKYIL
jgi:hypothetical protein